MDELKLVYLPVDSLTPYDNNARKHTEHDIEAIKESIKQSGGFNDPIGIWGENNLIVEGHGRLIAAKELGMNEVPCIRLDHLSDEERKKYAVLHNQTALLSEWDELKLKQELSDLDFEGFDFEFYVPSEDNNGENEPDGKYTGDTKIPQYEPYRMNVSLEQCIDTGKADELVAEIQSADVTDEEKTFLCQAAMRHYVFNYAVIAEYYANASEEMQRLMEKSALVIIDVDDAIANGYAKISKAMREMREQNER